MSTDIWTSESTVTRAASVDAVKAIMRELDVPNVVIDGCYLRDDIVAWACESCSPDTYPTTYASLKADIIQEWAYVIAKARA